MKTRSLNLLCLVCLALGGQSLAQVVQNPLRGQGGNPGRSGKTA
jgi:hypothetical protein